MKIWNNFFGGSFFGGIERSETNNFSDQMIKIFRVGFAIVLPTLHLTHATLALKSISDNLG
jgi:hypothetical protein